jgi:hypothetical protein
LFKLSGLQKDDKERDYLLPAAVPAPKAKTTIELTELVTNTTNAKMANGLRLNRRTALRISTSTTAEITIANPRLTIKQQSCDF